MMIQTHTLMSPVIQVTASMMIQTHTLMSPVIQVTASMMIQTHTLMSQVIQVSSEQFDSTQQSDCTGTPWQPCGRERGGGRDH